MVVVTEPARKSFSWEIFRSKAAFWLSKAATASGASGIWDMIDHFLIPSVLYTLGYMPQKKRIPDLLLLCRTPKVWTLIDNSGEVPKVIALERDEMIRIIDRSAYTALVKRYGRK